MTYTLIGDIPVHQYALVDSSFTHKTPQGFLPCIWFGLVSYPGRVWGCNILFPNGAVYRNIPIHALAWKADSEWVWTPKDAQSWDCYDYDFTVIEYEFLKDAPCLVRANVHEYPGRYLFTIAPLYDGWSARTDQAKEFSFVALENGRYTVQPTNHLLICERSFVKNPQWPTEIKLQTQTYSCEE
jgi:hypothetical protein